MRRFLVVFLVGFILALGSTRSEAGLGKLIAKGLHAVGRKVGIVGRETAEAGVRSSVRRTATAAPVILKRSASARTAGRVATALGSKATSVTARNLGSAGAAAARRLSPAAAKRFADVSAVLAKSPHKATWLTLVQRHGDSCADFIWRHKGSLAVASAGTGLALHPSAFTQMVSSGVETAGSHIAEPLIAGATHDVMRPMVESAIGTPGRAGLSIWGWSLCNGLLLGAGGLWWWRRRTAK